MTDNTLVAIYSSHQGKLSDKWAIYLHIYERVLSRLRDRKVNLLEIGIQNGGSLDIWAKYFWVAKNIIGCDINEKCDSLSYEDSRISVIVGDANSDDVESTISKVYSKLDIIIDDGSHRSSDIVKTFSRYFPLLNDDGIFLAEDLHCSYWIEFEGGLFDPTSSMAFFKCLADIINHEHWGISSKRSSVLEPFMRTYGVSFSEDELDHIHSIEFINSMCVVRKNAPIKNRLGARIQVGQEASIEQILAIPGSVSSPADQVRNPFSQTQILPEDDIVQLRKSKQEIESAHMLAERRVFDAENAIAVANTRASIAQRHSWTMMEKIQKSNQEIQSNHGNLIDARDRAIAFEKLAIERQIAINEILNSTSWRAAWPIRWAGRQRKRALRIIRLLPASVERAGGIGRLTLRLISILRGSGLKGVRNSLRIIETNSGLNTNSLKHGSENYSTRDPLEDVARKIYYEQQGELTPSEIIEITNKFTIKPLISVLMPVYNTPGKWLIRAIESLREQLYENWELCVVDDFSPTSEQREILAKFQRLDSRVRFSALEMNGGISAASNTALDMARGEFVALVDHDDELPPDALFWIANAIDENPAVDFIYTDECKIDDSEDRRLFHFLFKPDWSPELMFNGMLTGHLTVYRKNTVDALGGFRSEYDFSQDYDLALRMSEVAKSIVHIERVLYLWRSIPGSAASGGKDFARESNIAALDDAILRRGIVGAAVPLSHANYVSVTIPKNTTVSIVMPSDSFQNVKLALNSILNNTTYLGYEVIVVCNGPLAERLTEEFGGVSNVNFLHYNKKYNFSDKCNEGARAASGNIVVFYNDDVFPAQDDWIERLVEYLFVPGVGGVSPKLLHKDETIQYAGMIAGTPGLGGTAYNNVRRDANDSFLSQHKYVRNVSILSGACFAIKRAVFWEAGGFDAVNTPDGHSDMDLSFKLLKAGYRCAYTPYSVLFHVGNHSWGEKKKKYKADIFMLKRWGNYLSRDPNFTDSMKLVLYHDFRFNYKIFASHIDPTKEYTGLDVLFATDSLMYFDGFGAFIRGISAVQKSNGFSVVVAPTDGPLRAVLEKQGVVVIVDESLNQKHFLFERFARNFDSVVVGSKSLANAVAQLIAIKRLSVVWWLYDLNAENLDWVRENIGSSNGIQVLFGSGQNCEPISDEARFNVIHTGIEDERCRMLPSSKFDSCTVALAGAHFNLRSRSLFSDAINLLPKKISNHCRFVMFSANEVSKSEPKLTISYSDSEILAPTVEHVAFNNRDQLLQMLNEVDVIVCCAGDEASLNDAISALMLAKPLIVCSSIRLSCMIEDGESGLIFDDAKVESLAEMIAKVVSDPVKAGRIGLLGRAVYEAELTADAFSEKFLRLIQGQEELRLPVVQ